MFEVDRLKRGKFYYKSTSEKYRKALKKIIDFDEKVDGPYIKVSQLKTIAKEALESDY